MLSQAASFSMIMLSTSFLPFKRKGRQSFQRYGIRKISQNKTIKPASNKVTGKENTIVAIFLKEDFYRVVYYYKKRVVWLDLTA
jgi:hypothetical protein